MTEQELTAAFNGFKDRVTSMVSGLEYRTGEMERFLNKNLAYMQHRLDALEHPNVKETPSTQQG